MKFFFAIIALPGFLFFFYESIFNQFNNKDVTYGMVGILAFIIFFVGYYHWFK
jgi:hypothetical protein